MTPDEYCQDKAAKSGSSFYYSFLFLPPEQRNINTALIARGIKLKEGNQYNPVRNFAVFTAREMIEIRNHAELYDPDITGNVQIQHPRTLETEEISILAIKDFFYPAKI